MDSLMPIVQPFSLLLCRFSPLFLAANMGPLAMIPAMVRLVLLLILVGAFSLPLTDTWQPMQQAGWLVGLGFELMLGLMLLLGVQLSLAAIHMVGRMLDMQIGFMAAGVIDPVSHHQNPLIGHILALFITLLFFLTDTHHQVLQALSESIALIPPGTWLGTFPLSYLLAYFSTHMVLAMLLVGPIVIALWLIDLFNGVLSRSMPQMNVYFVMLPLKIWVGLFLLAVSARHMKPVIAEIFTAWVNWFRLGGL